MMPIKQDLVNPKTLELMFCNCRWDALNGRLVEANRWMGLARSIIDEDPTVLDKVDRNVTTLFEETITLLAAGVVPTVFVPIDSFDHVSHDSSALLEHPNDFLMTESDLRRAFVHDMGSILPMKFSRICLEKTVDSGRIDVLAVEEGYGPAWIFELKAVVADHAVVSQVAKYMLSMEASLLHRTFSCVKGAVVAPGFKDYALQMLIRMGVHTIAVSHSEDDCVTYSDPTDRLIGSDRPSSPP